jgi:hypothetical protein
MEYEAQTPKSFQRRLYSRYRYYSFPLRMAWHERREHAWRWLAWHLPHELVSWAVIRLWAHGTTGEYGNTHPDELQWGEAMRRWDKR